MCHPAKLSPRRVEGLLRLHPATDEALLQHVQVRAEFLIELVVQLMPAERRTSQGTIAWVISLITVPFVAIPLYWLLGRTRFSGTVGGRRKKDERLAKLAESMHERLRQLEVDIPEDDAFERAAHLLGGLPFTRGNKLELLIDGEETFERIFKAISEAESYLCVNFFIVKNDQPGHPFPAGAHRTGAGRGEGVFPVR